jgi:hypothetical protein
MTPRTPSTRWSPGLMGAIPCTGANRYQYLADPGGNGAPERVASKEPRFSDNDEIRFCLPVDPSPRTVGPCHLAGTRQSVPSAIDRCKVERHDIRVVDHRALFRDHEQLLPTFNSLAIEPCCGASMVWPIASFTSTTT